VTSEEFAEWVAYENLHPDSSEINTNLLAQLLALMANVYRGREPQYVPSDFLPGGDRAGRLSRGMAVMAEYAAHHQAAKKAN
jgi:hypothetical protein